jgi:hypothetical protein
VNNWQYLYQLQLPFVNLLYCIQPLASSTQHAGRSIYQGYFGSSRTSNFEKSKNVAQQGGNAARVALKELESNTRTKVVFA